MEEKLKLWEKISKGEVIFPEDVLMCIDEKKNSWMISKTENYGLLFSPLMRAWNVG